MILTEIYTKLNKRLAFNSKSAFSHAIFGCRSSLAMMESRKRISDRSFDRAVRALKAMGHMDLALHLLVDRIRDQMPGRPSISDSLLTSSVILSSAIDPAMAIAELRGLGFPVRYRRVMPGSRLDSDYGEHVLETSDDGAVYGILSEWARPGIHRAWLSTPGARP